MKRSMPNSLLLLLGGMTVVLSISLFIFIII
nr:MAG TPA: TM Leucine-rich repeat family 19 TM domain [Crassvirales sp.]